ncbi:MAG: glycosyltransferase [Bacteroidales bacterium]|nr:glycosyltransferase [Bacteroidales bacterium]
MYIYLLTSVYPSNYSTKGTTPVVHYFAKEWVLQGHQVHIFHTESVFPKAYYLIGKLFKNLLDSKLGHLVPTQVPNEYDEIKDGVEVTHLLLKKSKPHGRFSTKQVDRAFEIISSYIDKESVPDCFVGHWDNPQLELLHALKRRFHRPTCLVYHSNGFLQLFRCYGQETNELVKDVDLVGFRNITARMAYEKQFGKLSHSFIAASGVSKPFIEAGLSFVKEIGQIKRFVYVGALIHRKYPDIIVESLDRSFQKEPFEITYIGEGGGKKNVKQKFDALGCCGKLTFTGRIPREEVINYLKQSDVFVMISKGELFGLVYLEAMALGCITIAARHEGIDGIIEEGVNGFLCEAGNVDELAAIILKIRQMSPEALRKMSLKAKQTAAYYSDVNVSKRYIEELKSLVNHESNIKNNC